MKTGIASLRGKLSELLAFVQKGGELEIQKHNVTIAKIVPVNELHVNKTKLGVGQGTVKVDYPHVDSIW